MMKRCVYEDQEHEDKYRIVSGWNHQILLQQEWCLSEDQEVECIKTDLKNQIYSNRYLKRIEEWNTNLWS